jgi:ABC-type dipeptide/oligopeptide/nickel transport system permease component
MYRYITIRLGQAIITLWFLSLVVFLSVHLTGNPALYLLGPEGTRQDYEQLKRNMGLDKALPVQYGLFLSKAVRGLWQISHHESFSTAGAPQDLFGQLTDLLAALMPQASSPAWQES